MFILAFLGLNIFVYLAAGTQDITNIFKPVLTKILGLLGLTVKGVVDITSESTRAVTNAGAQLVDTTTTAIQTTVDKPFETAEASAAARQQGGPSTSQAVSSVSSSSFQKPVTDVMQGNTLNNALNSAASSGGAEYEADDSSSSIQQGGSKAGWCYIGEDRGFRTCVQVGVNDTCMSGDIFPSQEICINPNLRP